MSINNPKKANNATLDGLVGTVNNFVQDLTATDAGGFGILGGIAGAIKNEIGNSLGNLLGFPLGGNLSNGDGVVRLQFKPAHPYASYPGILQPLQRTGGMIFPYRPDVAINRPVNYTSLDVVHSMHGIRQFKNGGEISITITGEFQAQQYEEARYLQASIHFLRTASLMSFGRGGAVPAGMPPPVLNLNAYGVNNLNNLPVTLDAYITDYPKDVDYIRVDGNDVATQMVLTTTMKVALSPNQMRRFSLDAFASGNMQNMV